ncbi:unnamed protein product [Symbiodinium natans]|uniref:Uncharacterized protein n=1 Tax=Symbiodinium natans TaxID=878477 RepID=A0A812RSZ2_9DINO|nr:unnamed protein product [Symbiodinium natans]
MGNTQAQIEDIEDVELFGPWRFIAIASIASSWGWGKSVVKSALHDADARRQQDTGGAELLLPEATCGPDLLMQASKLDSSCICFNSVVGHGLENRGLLIVGLWCFQSETSVFCRGWVFGLVGGGLWFALV